MIKYILKFLLLSLILCSCNTKEYTHFVDPFIGTAGHGHTYPGAQLPFGMVQLSPDTRNDESWDGCSGYHKSDSTIIGFSHTHLSGTGVSDYGDILLMPITKNFTLESGTSDNPDSGYRSRFSKEKAEPGYYSVFLDDYNVNAELSATERVGFHRYTFSEAGNVDILLDLIHRDPVIESEILVVGDNKIIGKRRSKYWAGDQQLFFAIEFSKPFEKVRIYDNKKEIESSQNVKGKSLQSRIVFSVRKDENIEIKLALSSVSADGAMNNLEKESKNISFDKARESAKTKWNKALSKIEVEGGTDKQKRIFYTSLYHSLLSPNISQDIDGKYRGMDGKVHNAEGFTNYTVFSLWDTFRALHPLLTILEPERTSDFAACLVQKSKEYGELPMWELASNDTRCMIGYHAVSLIADAYIKGINTFDIEEAYVEMKKTAMLDKRGLKAYKTLGYVPSNKSSQSVSKTLEYAYNDWCIAQVAKLLNKADDYNYFMNRSTNYKNLYDSSVSFMRAKNDDHTWVKDFDPTAVGYNYTEGNSFQYSLFVPHDISGLTNLIGGKDKLERWLDRLFTTEMKHELGDDTDVSGLIGQYAHGNEPSHHMAYLYNYADASWKSQEIIRRIMRSQYNDTADGLCGNEDCGQMSAWYVLSAMGFYSDCPGSPYYSIGSPIFDKVKIHLDNGKTFTITAHNNSAKNIFIQSATLNKMNHNNFQLSHKDILEGGELSFVMGETPNKDWGKDYKLVNAEYKSAPLVYLSESSDYFLDSFLVDMKVDSKDADIYYTLDGTEPNKESNKYTKAFEINESTQLKMRSYKEACEDGYIVNRNLKKQEVFTPNTDYIEQGLLYNYYEGIYRSVYDYALDSIAKSDICPVPSLSVCVRNEWIGVDFKGLIKIPRKGKYTFYMSSNDGCQLIINSEEQFESDGRKSNTFDQQSSILLSAAYHEIEMKFYQCSDKSELRVEWEGPGIKRQAIPSSVFYHLKN